MPNLLWRGQGGRRRRAQAHHDPSTEAATFNQGEDGRGSQAVAIRRARGRTDRAMTRHVGGYESFKKNYPHFYFDFGGYEPKFRETFVKEISQPLKFQNKIELTHSLA